MQIILAENIGFCDGVERSVRIALAEGEKGKNVFLNHPLIHNKIVMDSLRQKGIEQREESALSKGDTLVVSAHGASKKYVDRLTEKGIAVVDATCPIVKKIHEKVYEHYKNGDELYVFGDRNHAEIRALTEDFPTLHVVENIDEIDFSADRSFFIFTQTTYNTLKLKNIQGNLKKIADKLKKTVVFFDSICYTTIRRQIEAERISAQADVMLVVGDKTSSNTNKLFSICKANCPKTYLIENVSDVKSVQIEKNNKVLGIVSGASAPRELIMEVFYIMNEVNTTEKT